MALALAVGLAGLAASPAVAQTPPPTPVPATITSVVDGDTLDAQLADGSLIQFQLIGIDAPEQGDCGGDAATSYLEQLAFGRSVTS